MPSSSSNTVFVGKKGTMSYVLAVVTQMNQGAREVTVKARGKAISRAVDVAEIAKAKFLKDLKVRDIRIGTEEIRVDEENTLKISSIEIVLEK